MKRYFDTLPNLDKMFDFSKTKDPMEQLHQLAEIEKTYKIGEVREYAVD